MSLNQKRKVAKGKDTSNQNVLAGLVGLAGGRDASSQQPGDGNSYAPSQAAFEIHTVAREIKTKQEVVKMIEPLIEGVSQQGIHTTKLQIDHDELTKRVSALEVVFNGGKGKNFIWDSLTS